MRRAYWCPLIALCIVAGYAGCTIAPAVSLYNLTGQVWPEPPAQARIQFVAEFSGPEDLGIRDSVWDKLVSLSAGAEDKSMVRPMAVAATGDAQTIYVADPDARCVHRFDLARGRYHCLSHGLESPVGLAITSTGRLFVADSALDTIFMVESGGDDLVALTLSPPVIQPTGIAVDETGDMYIANTANHVVRRYNAAGQLVRQYGGRGFEIGRMNFPTYVWLENAGQFWVTDTMNFRVQRFDTENGALSAFGEAGDGTGSFARPKGVALDRHGHVYVIDAQHNALHIFDQEGQLLLAIGERGVEQGKFWLPNGIFVTAQDMIFVADSYNHRVQVFRYVGDTS